MRPFVSGVVIKLLNNARDPLSALQTGNGNVSASLTLSFLQCTCLRSMTTTRVLKYFEQLEMSHRGVARHAGQD